MGSGQRINSRVAAISPSVTLGISATAKCLQEEGRKICSFAAGEPDFDTPAHIKEAACAALMKGETKYTPTAGLKSLCVAISEKLLSENGLVYAPDQIIVNNGAKHSLYNLMVAVCDGGDEVVLPVPYWLSYPEMIRMAGGVPIFVDCGEEDDFKMTPEKFKNAITDRTKAVIINSPSNPDGVVYSREELIALAEVAIEHRVLMISDEIYEKLVFDGAEHYSVGSYSQEALDLTITVNGFSKAYAMTGWRLGYLAAPKKIAMAVDALQGHSTSGPNTFAQFGAIAALKGPQECVKEMVNAFAQRREYLFSRLSSIPGITCVNPRGAFYMFPNISSTGLGSVQFAERLLKEQGVAVVPGVAFGRDENVRFSYACSMENIRKGMDGFEAFMKSL